MRIWISMKLLSEFNRGLHKSSFSHEEKEGHGIIPCPFSFLGMVHRRKFQSHKRGAPSLTLTDHLFMV